MKYIPDTSIAIFVEDKSVQFSVNDLPAYSIGISRHQVDNLPHIRASLRVVRLLLRLLPRLLGLLVFLPSIRTGCRRILPFARVLVDNARKVLALECFVVDCGHQLGADAHGRAPAVPQMLYVCFSFEDGRAEGEASENVSLRSSFTSRIGDRVKNAPIKLSIHKSRNLPRGDRLEEERPRVVEEYAHECQHEIQAAKASH